MRRRLAFRGVVACAVVLVLVTGCKKKRAPLEIEAGPPAAESTADIEAKDAVAVIVSSYPSVCDADVAARAWTACREAGGGYSRVYGCAEKGLRESRAALNGLRPSTTTHAECGEEINKAAIAMLNATPRFFADVTRWLQEQHDVILPILQKMPLGEACRTTKDLCAREPHDYDDTYKAMRLHGIDAIECTTKIFRCGQKDAMDCWLGNVAPRLGVACPGTANRTGASPDDLLYVRETGTPIAR